jgi:hypothetical protein
VGSACEKFGPLNNNILAKKVTKIMFIIGIKIAYMLIIASKSYKVSLKKTEFGYCKD